MEIPESVAVIDFPEGHTFHGLEVRMTLDITIDEAMRVGNIGEDSGETSKLLGGLLRGWNVTRKGVPVPCTEQGLGQVPLPFLVAVIKAYQRALVEVMSVDDPFAAVSNGTST